MHYLHWILAAIVSSVIVSPILQFMIVGRHVRRQEIIEYFPPTSIRLYFREFWRGSAKLQALADQAEALESKDADNSGRVENERKLREEFDKLYNSQFGPSTYVCPILIIFTLVILESFMCLDSVLSAKTGLILGRGMFSGVNLEYTAIAAIAGAYMWVAGDIIFRTRRRDCLPSDIYWHCLRLAIAVPLGYSMATIVNAAIGPFIAFAMGAFPIDAITRMLRRLANRALNLEDDKEEATELVNLTGVDGRIAAAMAAEGITTIQQLTCMDPILLSMRSNLPFGLIMECINEGLAWRYFKEKPPKLRTAGLRGAYEMIVFVDELLFEPDSTAPADDKKQAERLRNQENAKALLKIMADAAGCDPLELQNGLTYVAGESYAQFMYRVWN